MVRQNAQVDVREAVTPLVKVLVLQVVEVSAKDIAQDAQVDVPLHVLQVVEQDV